MRGCNERRAHAFVDAALPENHERSDELLLMGANVHAMLVMAEAINKLADAVNDHSCRIDNVTKDGRLQLDVFGEVST